MRVTLLLNSCTPSPSPKSPSASSLGKNSHKQFQSKGQVALQKRMNFRKSSKQPLTPSPPSFSENHVAIFKFHAERAQSKICNINFWIENYFLPLELFQKSIRFGSGIRPLVTG